MALDKIKKDLKERVGLTQFKVFVLFYLIVEG